MSLGCGELTGVAVTGCGEIGYGPDCNDVHEHRRISLSVTSNTHSSQVVNETKTQNVAIDNIKSCIAPDSDGKNVSPEDIVAATYAANCPKGTYEGYQGECCTWGDILRATNVSNNNDSSEGTFANIFLATSAKAACASEHIKGKN